VYVSVVNVFALFVLFVLYVCWNAVGAFSGISCSFVIVWVQLCVSLCMWLSMWFVVLKLRFVLVTRCSALAMCCGYCSTSLISSASAGGSVLITLFDFFDIEC